MRLRDRIVLIGLGMLIASLVPLSAQAGCGCDHPPPAWSVVMPPFASPGKTVTIFAADGAFTPGASYVVKFGSPSLTVVATMADRLEVVAPDGMSLGPVEIEVQGAGYDHKYGRSDFTALPHPRAIPEVGGHFGVEDYAAAVGEDGTLYLPLDLSDARSAMQFAMGLVDTPLRYSHDEVILYNADGVDLTLFTLNVDASSERQWGSYFGWEVEEDSGLPGLVFRGQRAVPPETAFSDVFTYWRHEFDTYAAAHAPGGSHEVDDNGLHPDGSVHVDHDNVVIAIRGLEDGAPLGPGERQMDLGWVSMVVDDPVSPTLMSTLLKVSSQWGAPLLERMFRERD